MDLDSVIIPLTSRIMSYGPWYAPYADAKGSVRITVDESLVPWNFYYPQDLDPYYSGSSDGLNPEQRLEQAGQTRLERTYSVQDYIDSATIAVVGFPEFGHGTRFGYNSNLTAIHTTFGTEGVKTTYNFSTYTARPGTFRKDEYDNLSRVKIDARATLPVTENISIAGDIFGSIYGINRFKD